MKTASISALAIYSKKAALILTLISCIYGIDALGQNERRGQQRSRNYGENPARQSPQREQTIQHARVSRPPAQARQYDHANINRERGVPRLDNNINRRSNVYNRPENTLRNPGNVNFNRPANNSSRPGIYNRRGNSNIYNKGNKDYRDYGRNNYYRRPVYNTHNPNWRYAHTPRRNSIFNSLPSSYFSINFGGLGYRYYDGIYYRPYNNFFRVVAPPIGIFVNVLPVGHRRIYVNNYPYYYYNGTYYDYRDNSYTVVSPPVGAVVESIPDGFETLTIDGETYYVADGAQYKPVVQEDGEIWYEVIKSNS